MAATTTLPSWLARECSDAPWITVYDGATAEPFTRAGLFTQVLRWAAGLESAGVVRGDRVLLFLPNGADFIAAFLGAGWLGAIAVPVAWPFFFDSLEKRAVDLLPLFGVAEPAAIVTTDRGAAALVGTTNAPILTEPGPGPLDSRCRAVADEPAFIQFTSGSTGTPRGAVISHRAAIASASAMGKALRLSPDDVGVSWLPLFHDMGLVGTVFCSLVYGFPLHLMKPSEFLLHPRRWLELLSRVGATLTVAPNFGYDLAMRRVRDPSPGALDFSRLRAALNGSEPVHRSTIDAFESRFAACGWRPGTILPVYGLAENTLGVSFAAPGPPAPDLAVQGRRVPSVGAPLEDTEVEIRGSDGRTLPDDSEGQIFVRSSALFDGYFRDPTATADSLVDGWLATGDLGVIHAGQLYVTGREKELIIKGGQKFHPHEIERVVAAELELSLHQVAAVSLRNDARGTEDLAVVIEHRAAVAGLGVDASARVPERAGASAAPEPRPRDEDGSGRNSEWASAESDLGKRVRGRLMEALGVRAEHVCLVAPGTIPRTTSGKLRRRDCAARLQGLS